MNHRGAVIFDFDGVLADTEEAAYRVVGRVARKKGLPLPSREFLKNHTTQQNLATLKVRWWELPYYAALSRKWAAEEEPQIRLFPWTPLLLQSPEPFGGQVWIVSSNSNEAIQKTLRENSMLIPQDRVRGGIGIFGKSAALKKLLRQEGLSTKKTLYVGDETRDIDAARRAGIQAVAVSWGFHSSDLLKAHGPDYLVKDAAEFESVVRRVLT